MAGEFTVKLHWFHCGDDDDPRWGYNRALYAYLAPVKAAIYYIGKCYGETTTVRRRWTHDAKQDVWKCINARTKNHCPIVAEFELPEGARLSKKLVDDIECLLIFRLQPPCNVQCIESRGKYRRPGMKVVCVGKAWPLSKRTFTDGDD
jgi:hypothetical protein